MVRMALGMDYGFRLNERILNVFFKEPEKMSKSVLRTKNLISMTLCILHSRDLSTSNFCMLHNK